jgi:hypothetical protein
MQAPHQSSYLVSLMVTHRWSRYRKGHAVAWTTSSLSPLQFYFLQRNLADRGPSQVVMSTGFCTHMGLRVRVPQVWVRVANSHTQRIPYPCARVCGFQRVWFLSNCYSHHHGASLPSFHSSRFKPNTSSTTTPHPQPQLQPSAPFTHLHVVNVHHDTTGGR